MFPTVNFRYEDNCVASYVAIPESTTDSQGTPPDQAHNDLLALCPSDEASFNDDEELLRREAVSLTAELERLKKITQAMQAQQSAKPSEPAWNPSDSQITWLTMTIEKNPLHFAKIVLQNDPVGLQGVQKVHQLTKEQWPAYANLQANSVVRYCLLRKVPFSSIQAGLAAFRA